jgi:hypothetical protein
MAPGYREAVPYGEAVFICIQDSRLIDVTEWTVGVICHCFLSFFYLKNEEYPELTGNQAVWTDWCGLQGIFTILSY